MTSPFYDPFGPMTFPYGSELTVLRGSRFDEFGDRVGAETEYTIGPCAISVRENPISYEGDGPHNRQVVTVTCPPDSDIREDDRIRLPSGAIAVVQSAPLAPRNPFTGWAPFIKVVLSAE